MKTEEILKRWLYLADCYDNLERDYLDIKSPSDDESEIYTRELSRIEQDLFDLAIKLTRAGYEFDYQTGGWIKPA